MPKVTPEYKEEARQRILTAAQAVFAEKGYDQATMDDIAQKLGVSRGGLYLYFSNKEEIFSVIAQLGQQRLSELLRNSFLNRGLVEGAALFFENMVSHHWDYLYINFDIIAQATRNLALRELLKDYYEGHIATITRFLDAQRGEGVVRRDIEARPLAVHFFALFNGLVINVALGIDKDEMKREWIQSVVSMLCDPSKRDECLRRGQRLSLVL